MKKTLITIFSVLVLFSVSLFAFAGCKDTHTHEFGKWTIVKQATCEENGTKTRKCKECDETEQETITALGHTYGDYIPELPATCVQEGVKGHFECSVCHKYFDEEHNEITDLAIAAEHALFLVKGKEATCTEDGVMDVYRCSACRQLFDENGNLVTDTVIPAKGHTLGELIPEVPATATENGVKAHKDCTVCGLHFDDDGNELDSLVIPASEHNYGSWIEEVPATCTENGTKAHFACSHCSANFDENYNVIEDLTIPAGHVLTFYKRIEPTCEKVGNIAGYACENCSALFDENKTEVEDFVLAALGHTYGEWEEEVPATCTENGVKAHKTCTRCNKNFDNNDREIDVVISASHNLNMVAEISATCTENGRQAYGQCSGCNKYFNVFGEEITDLNGLEIPAKNHAFGNWVEAIEASCTDSGLLGHYHCRNCNKDYDKNGAEIESVYLAALGHLHTTEEIIPRKDATCLENGYIEHFECSRCGATTNKLGIDMDVTIDKKGHISGMYTGIKVPTCTEPGVGGYYTCSVCGDRFSSDDFFKTVTDEDLVIQPTGHKYIYIEREEPTCELEGCVAHYICDNTGCNWVFDTEKQAISYTDLYIKPTMHELGDWVEEKPATETEDGYKGHYQCKKCGYYFNEGRNRIFDTIVIPKTLHTFGSWISEVSATCTTNGTKGHFNCSHCNKDFDSDYKEIDDLTIPAHHNVDKLTPASQAKCFDDDVLVPYYFCYDCHNYIGEDMNILKYDDIFRQADRHDDVLSRTSEMYHFKQCQDCGREISEMHQFEFEYITDENNVPTKKGTCMVCDYVYSDVYYPVDRVYLESDMYVGYHYSGMFLFVVRYRDGNESHFHDTAVMSAADARRFADILNSSADGFETRTETFTVRFLNFTSEIEITFRPFIVYGVVTTENVYRQGSLANLSDLTFVYDCNYTRDTGEEILLNGSITDDGGFDPDFDFTASGLTEKTFTVKYTYNETEYDVAVTLTNGKMPAYINYYESDYVLLGDELRVEIVYSDYSRKYVTVTDEMITSGTFDPNVLGKQTITVSIEGLVKTITVNVRDPYEISYMYLNKYTIELGEELQLFVVYLRAGTDLIDVTPDMIEGVFDNNTLGSYEITVAYGGKLWTGEVKVINPDDSRADSIELYFSSSLIWDVKDGKMIENLDYMYIHVFRNNDTNDYVEVTRDMISYDKAEADAAIENRGVFRLLITYYGKTCTTYVLPREIEPLNVYYITTYDKTNLNNSNCSVMYMKDGDLSNYFVYVSASGGYYCLPVSKDMFYESGKDSELVAFDVDGAENGEYSVTLKFGEQDTRFFYLVKYTESDVKYSFSAYRDVKAVAGTKEQVLERLANATLMFRKSVYGHDFGFIEFYFSELVLAPTDGIDFGTPGYIKLDASYKGVAGTVYVCLLPDVDDVEYTTYKISRSETLALYKNGYACLNKDQWGSYTCINARLNLYRVDIFDWSEYQIYMLNGDIATRFMAEMLEDNLEIYSLYTMDGLCSVRIYTKNAFSLADFYNENGDYRKTYVVTFSADGKYVYLDGKKYAFGENNMLEIMVEGNVVYRYHEELDENVYGSGTLNDNGLFYITMVEIADDGSETEYVVEVYEWTEKNGVVTLYSNGQLAGTGKIVDGYFVPDYN